MLNLLVTAVLNEQESRSI